MERKAQPIKGLEKERLSITPDRSPKLRREGLKGQET